jgi:transcription-repair coupling factor (superfamily II helicase)
MQVETLADLRALTARLKNDDSFRAVADALRAGGAGTIDGAWGSSKSLAAAALAESTDKTLVVVVPHPSDVEPFAADLGSMSDARPVVLPPLEDAGRADDSATLVARESYGRRLQVLKSLLGSAPPRIVVASIAALLQPLPSVQKVVRNSRRIARGETLDLADLARWLVDQGWTRRDAVDSPGEFSVRGGVVDLFPVDAEFPFRVELFGDEVDSIREFEPLSQRSVRALPDAEVTALSPRESDSRGPSRAAAEADDAHLADLIGERAWFALVEPQEIQQEGEQYLNRLEDDSSLFRVEDCWRRMVRRPSVVLAAFPYPSAETVCTLHVESVERFSGDSTRVLAEFDRTVGADRVLLACHNDAEAQRLAEVLAETATAREGRLRLTTGQLAAGFRWVSERLVVLSDDELFHRPHARRAAAKRRFQSRAIDSFVELSPGDYVVHLAHGVGVYRGMKMLEKNAQLEEHLTIEFADGVRIYVPAGKMDLVQKYIGAGKAAPRLSKVGGALWEQRKRRVQAAVRDLAVDLLEVQAARQTQPGVQFPPDSAWQRQFESTFPWDETADQVASLAEIKADMESPRPMDRLLCGDVGYGKTELAIRAAFKAADFGKQVAVLAPTTVLAQQHLRTFRERMAEYPFVVEALTRFESRREQRDVLSRLKAGGVDVLVGTHRLLSQDVEFHDLGLIVVDEEQRFGVAHKEKLKRLRSQVDVLTMTATPIPRTLHAALLGIRDISNLETPPENRLAVETRIVRWDPTMLRHAILRELNRDGQIYFVHNRIQDIHQVADRLKAIAPEARIGVVHGRLHEDDVERRMIDFLERRTDVLLATTIIESGLDIPNANTIFIDDGDRYGLAELHQLRGRVGRSRQRAYCYILVDESRALKPDAQRRLKAIEEYSQLGAGFQIALRDLEIRGAGNILGPEQSGHIAAVGYELYCQLLENAVRAARKQPVRSFLDVTIELPWRAYLPHEYIPGERLRIDAYRRLARIRDLDDLNEFRVELRDRYGPLPEAAANFVDLAELRILAQIWQIESIRPDPDGNLVLEYRDRRRLETLEKLRKREVFAVDAKSAYIRVPPDRRRAPAYAATLKRLLQPS